jgi:hypothetical protein
MKVIGVAGIVRTMKVVMNVYLTPYKTSLDWSVIYHGRGSGAALVRADSSQFTKRTLPR